MAERESSHGDATRRTFLAQERTLLAWWRSGLAALAVAIAIGRLVPALLHVPAAPFVAIGVGFGLVGVAFVVLGALRDRAVRAALATGRFEPLDTRTVSVITLVIVVLGLVTLVLLILES